MKQICDIDHANSFQSMFLPFGTFQMIISFYIGLVIQLKCSCQTNVRQSLTIFLWLHIIIDKGRVPLLIIITDFLIVAAHE